MKKATTFAVVIGALFCGSLSTQAVASHRKVFCDKGQTIQKALKRFQAFKHFKRPGRTLLVFGTCRENLLITEEFLNITIDGQGVASIIAADPDVQTIRVRGRGVRIKGFTIQGGFRAIALQNGGSAIIKENTIEQSQTFGVQVGRNSFARILNNKILNNGQDGINVRLSASADVFDNIITGNRDGINVDSGGSADISGNHINNNLRDGVHLRDNSHARFSADPDNQIENIIESNDDNGLDCGRGGTISGNTINFGAGNLGGNTDIAGSCHVEIGVLP